MASKKSNGSGLLIVLVAGFAAVSAAFKWVDENRYPVAGLVAAIAGFFVLRSWLRKRAWRARFVRLTEKFGSEQIAQKIMDQMFWEGQTDEQLRESMGTPVAIDSQVLKTKTKEIWKYHQVRKGQFLLRITLEKGKVVGWESRS